ncbi:MAG: HAD family hydrolase [Desulfobacteraceae bacterium]
MDSINGSHGNTENGWQKKHFVFYSPEKQHMEVANEFRKRYRLGIITDAQRLFCNPEMRTLRLEDFFDATVISSDYGFRKPDPRLFHIALAALDVPASEAAHIGNSYETDLLGAKAAGLAVAGLIRQSEDQKKAYNKDHEPDFITEDLRGALDFFSVTMS